MSFFDLKSSKVICFVVVTTHTATRLMTVSESESESKALIGEHFDTLKKFLMAPNVFGRLKRVASSHWPAV